MKTRKQIAEEIHDDFLKEIVLLNNKVRVYEYMQKDKEARATIVERERLEDKMNFLEKEEGLG